MTGVDVPSAEWVTERLADYKACRSHREVTAVQAMIDEVVVAERGRYVSEAAETEAALRALAIAAQRQHGECGPESCAISAALALPAVRRLLQ